MAFEHLMHNFMPSTASPALLVMINVKPFMVHDAEGGSSDKWLAGFPEELLIVLQKNRLDNGWAGDLTMSSNCDDFFWVTMRVVPLHVLLESPVEFLWHTSDLRDWFFMPRVMWLLFVLSRVPVARYLWGCI